MSPVLLVKEKLHTGNCSKSTLEVFGFCASAGSVTESTAALVSLAALSASTPVLNSIWIIETESREVEAKVFIFEIPAISSSSGSVTSDSTSAGFAPGKTVDTTTYGIFISGFNLLGILL